MITGETLADGDVLIGMASTGVHSNGFSLVRKIFTMDKETLDTYHEELGTTLGEALLAPTRIYVKALRAITRRCRISGVSSSSTATAFCKMIGPVSVPSSTKCTVAPVTFTPRESTPSWTFNP